MKRMKIMVMALLLIPIMLLHQGCAPGGINMFLPQASGTHIHT